MVEGMRAIRMHETGGPDVLQLDEVDRPSPGEGQVLVRVAVAGVNYADVGTRSGVMHGASELPAIPGFEVAGEVVEVGEGVDDALVGTHVAASGQGGYAEYAVVPALALLPVPEGVDLHDAVAMPVQGVTALGVLSEATTVARGDVVLVTAAAGGVGSLAVQIAKLLGAGRVVALASSQEKRALARRLGADDAVDYTEQGWVDRVRALGEGKPAPVTGAPSGPVDVALDSVGGPVAREALGLLRHRSGRMVTFGNASGEDSGIGPFALVPGNLTLVGFNADRLAARPRLADGRGDPALRLAAHPLPHGRPGRDLAARAGGGRPPRARAAGDDREGAARGRLDRGPPT